VALSQRRLEEWLASDISQLDLLVIQIDGLHVAEDIVLIGAIGIDGNGDKHILGLVEGATESAAAAQALLDNLIERGLDPKVPRLFILDGAKALSKAVRVTVGRQTLIQRCQVRKARNIAERCPKKHVASVRRTLRKAWELDDVAEAERLIRDLARRMEKEAACPAASWKVWTRCSPSTVSACRPSCAGRWPAPTRSRTCRARSAASHET
jgi:putative transposase